MLVVVIGVLPKAHGEPGLLDVPGVTPQQVGSFPGFGARVNGLVLHLCLGLCFLVNHRL